MNQLISISARIGEMSSLDFLNQIVNPSRIAAGEGEVRPSDFHARVTDEVDEVLNYDNFVVGKTGHKTHYTMLTMEQMTLVGMRESKAVRRQVLEKLKALGRQQVPQTYAAALLEAGRLAMELEQSQAQLAIAAPKAEFVDRYVESTGNLGFRQVAKLLKVKETDLREFLIGNKVMYRLAGVMTPYADHIDAGRFVVKAGMAEHGDSSHAYSQAKFTPKGVEWLAGELAKHEAKKLMEVE